MQHYYKITTAVPILRVALWTIHCQELNMNVSRVHVSSRPINPSPELILAAPIMCADHHAKNSMSQVGRHFTRAPIL